MQYDAGNNFPSFLVEMHLIVFPWHSQVWPIPSPSWNFYKLATLSNTWSRNHWYNVEHALGWVEISCSSVVVCEVDNISQTILSSFSTHIQRTYFVLSGFTIEWPYNWLGFAKMQHIQRFISQYVCPQDFTFPYCSKCSLSLCYWNMDALMAFVLG